jgi:hypothetical protein
MAKICMAKIKDQRWLSGSGLPASRILPSGSFRCDVHGQLPLDDREGASDFAYQVGEVGPSQRLLGIDHYVRRDAACRARKPNRFPQAPLHSIPLHGAAQRTAHGEAHTESRASPDTLLDSVSFRLAILRLPLCALPIKESHRSGKMPLAKLIDTLEVSVAQKALGARRAGFRHRLCSRALTRVLFGDSGAHGDLNVHFSNSSKKCFT